jgi:hypothetical protein
MLGLAVALLDAAFLELLVSVIWIWSFFPRFLLGVRRTLTLGLRLVLEEVPGSGDPGFFPPSKYSISSEV